jgi:DNA-directed RNA polymerase specialized sigma24 family protein
MPSDGSVTHWLRLLREGDSEAARQLWQRYYPLLVARAHAALGNRSLRTADEEDVVQSAFKSFYRGLQQGRFPDLADHDGLWGLLVVLTARKAARLARAEGAQKRGGGQVRAEADLPLGEEDEGALEQVVGQEPTPEFAAQMAEEYRRLLGRLDSDELSSIAVWKMEGHTVEEIAEKLGVAPGTVTRKLNIIRRLWREEAPS